MGLDGGGYCQVCPTLKNCSRMLMCLFTPVMSADTSRLKHVDGMMAVVIIISSKAEVGQCQISMRRSRLSLSHHNRRSDETCVDRNKVDKMIKIVDNNDSY